MSRNRPRYRPMREALPKGRGPDPALSPEPETPVHVQVAAQVRSLRRIGYDHGRIAERLGLEREEVGQYERR